MHGYIYDFPVLDAEVVGRGLIGFIHCCGGHELMCRYRCGCMSVYTSCIRDVRVWAKALEIKPRNSSQLGVTSEIHINSSTMWTELHHIFSPIALNIPLPGCERQLSLYWRSDWEAWRWKTVMSMTKESLLPHKPASCFSSYYCVTQYPWMTGQRPPLPTQASC